MSVFYNIVMNNKVRYPIRYICFGLLNCFHRVGGHNYDTDSSFYRSNLPAFSGDTSDILWVEYNYKRQTSQMSNEDQVIEKYLSNVEEFFDAFPWIRGTASINYKLGVIKVKAKHVPADKVMFIMTNVRNMLFEARGDVNSTNPETNQYEKLRTLIPDAKKRLIFSWLMSVSYYSGWGTTPSSWSCYPRFPDESNVLNVATFGKKSLKNLLSGKEPDWFQSDYNETEEGYLRDSHYYEEGMVFSTTEDLCSLDCEPDEWDGPGNHGHMLYRTMFDCMSEEFDEPLFFNSQYDPYVGFYFQGGTVSLEEYVTSFLAAAEVE